MKKKRPSTSSGQRLALTLSLILLTFNSACASAISTSPAAVNPYSFVLITAPANASPTPTAFQPSSLITSPQIVNFSTPLATSILLLPTETPSPTAPPAIQPTPTVDLNLIFPTIAAPPIVENPAIQPTSLPALTNNETINFLLIGSDKRPGQSYRTDTMVIVILWPQQGQVSLISIPRDLWIYIPTVGMQRINTAYQSGEIYDYIGGGPALLKDTIAYNFGIRIDHTAMVEFDGFRKIVDTLGGVQVPIACDYTDWRLIDPSYDPEDENNWWLYTVGPGLVHMDGDLALWYARSRSKSSDFDRGRRQQEVLRALLEQGLRTDSLSKIPQLYNDLSSSVITDLGLADLLSIAPYAPKLSSATIRGYYIRPPYVSDWTTPGGASVQLPNDELLKQLLVEATTLSSYTEQRQTITIEVQNGSGFDTLEALASSRLNHAGYKTSTSPADNRNYATSVIVDFTSAQDPSQRAFLRTMLGLSSATEIYLPNANPSAQYRIILGADYQACFKPEEFSH